MGTPEGNTSTEKMGKNTAGITPHGSTESRKRASKLGFFHLVLEFSTSLKADRVVTECSKQIFF